MIATKPHFCQISDSFHYVCKPWRRKNATARCHLEFCHYLMKELVAAMPNPSPQNEVSGMIECVHEMSDYCETDWAVIRDLLALVPDVHVDGEILFRKMILRRHGKKETDAIIALLEEYQVDLLGDDYTMLLMHSPNLFPIFHERCKGETFQIWKGGEIELIVSQYPMCFPTKCCDFRLDQMYVYTRHQLTVYQDNSLGVVAKRVHGKLQPLDESTTDYQTTTICTVDGKQTAITLSLPDFLVPAFLNQPSRRKSARSAIVPDA